PMANTTAPAIEASGIPAATPPKSTPTANPSGMLCKVIASTNKVVLCNFVSTPSLSLGLKLICRCGKYLSKKNRNNAPSPKPTAEGKTFANPSPSVISIAGASKLQKLAATITPPVKPSIPSKTERFMVFIKKTSDAPNAVSNQVKVVAISAPHTGSIDSKNRSEEHTSELQSREN